jgi:hypothetical protein
MAYTLINNGDSGFSVRTTLNEIIADANSGAFQGVQGIQGTTGAQGTQGTQGTQGAIGTQGTQGTQGNQGTTGETGAQGVQGTQGAIGTQGTIGETGAQGTQGVQGTEGLQGAIGTQGTQGLQGIQGETGAQGVQGTIGTQGTQGTQGTIGETGVQGIQGIQGSQGVGVPTGGTTGQALVKIDNTDYNTEWATIGGGSLGGTNYIFVPGDKNDTANAADIVAAYSAAKLLSPAVDNRITIVVAPGYYGFMSVLDMDTDYIDLVSLTGNDDVIMYRADLEDPFFFNWDTFEVDEFGNPIYVSANDVYLKGLRSKEVLSDNYAGFNGTPTYMAPFLVGDDRPLFKAENVHGGFFHFSGGPFGSYVLSGTFINCTGKRQSFANGGNASGTFVDCITNDANNYSFGGQGTSSGLFARCGGGGNSIFGNSTGTFIDCNAQGSFAFGEFSNATGVFHNCEASEYGFAPGGNASGKFYDCRSGFSSFGTLGGQASGEFTNCIGGEFSFAGDDPGSALNGKLYYCRLTEGEFATVSGGGRTIYCIDGNNDPNNQ